MKKIFVDTSGWGNLVVQSQEFHTKTKEIYLSAKQNNTRLTTTSYILTEITALFFSPLRVSRLKTIAFIEGIKNSSLVDIIHIDERIEQESWKLFSNRIDKDWSLVDCSSFVVMEEKKISDALTTDQHFEQAGFIR